MYSKLILNHVLPSNEPYLSILPHTHKLVPTQTSPKCVKLRIHLWILSTRPSHPQYPPTIPDNHPGNPGVARKASNTGGRTICFCQQCSARRRQPGHVGDQATIPSYRGVSVNTCRGRTIPAQQSVKLKSQSQQLSLLVLLGFRTFVNCYSSEASTVSPKRERYYAKAL